MVSFLADENFNGRIVRGLLRRAPHMDLVRAQDVGLSGIPDPAVLEWAAKSGRILLTHDIATMVPYSFDRIEQGLPTPGVLIVRESFAIGSVIDDLLLIFEAGQAQDFEGNVIYLPL